jgi:threonine dehydrogenase-like Zn-dependent dehydrogenase
MEASPRASSDIIPGKGVFMKALCLKGANELVLEDIPVPRIGDGDVLVGVKYCGICGTDLHGVRQPGFIPPGSYLGHEVSGVVAEVGKDAKGWKAGDRVVINPCYQCGECYACQRGYSAACRHAGVGNPIFCMGCSLGEDYVGGFASYVKVTAPERRLHRLPYDVSFEEGTLVEPLAVSLHAVRISTFKPGDYAMVMGGGMIGLGVIAFLKQAGARLIIVLKKSGRGLELLKRVGADYVFYDLDRIPGLQKQVLELTGGVGVIQVYECSGAPRLFRAATDFMAPRGQMVLVGLITQEVPIVPLAYVPNELSLLGSYIYNYGEEFPMVLDFLRKKTLPVADIITARIKLADVVEKGFRPLMSPGCQDIKILVSPD